MALPGFNLLSQLKNKIISLIAGYKILTLVSAIVTVAFITLGVRAIQGKSNFISGPKLVQKNPSPTVHSSPTVEASSSSLIHPPDFDTNVLGSSEDAFPTDTEVNYTFPTLPPLPPLPIPTIIAFPTSIPIPTSSYTYTPPPSCNGIPTAYNSQAYVSSTTSLVNSQVTISVELQDCNNSIASVNDNLTISLENNDPGTNINGSAAPVTIQAQNGKASFSVNSSNAVTDTFIITDTTRSFTVTDTHNHNPSVTFSNNTSGSSGCTTPGGVPNTWFSDVYPASPVSVMIGSSATFTVVIRDCNKNTVSVNEAVSISMSSGDSTTQVNGNNFPYSVTTVNGQTSFTIISQHAGTNSFVVRDTTSSFSITDPNNNNPSVVFTSPSTPTPTPAPSTPTPTTASQSPTPGLSPTLTSTPKPTVPLTPTSAATPTPAVTPPVPTSNH